MQRSLNEYAGRVLRALRGKGAGASEALRMVQLSEGAIEQGFRLKVVPAVLASQLLGGRPARGGKPAHAGRSSGRAVTVASVVGCASAPIEAYLFDEPASELPPLDHCPAPPQNKGLAAGIANMSFIDLKTQEKIWKGLLGRAVTRAELLSVYTGVTRSGAKVTTKIRSIRGSERDMSLHIAFDLDVDGYSGYMSRVFRPVRLGGETRCQVYHDQFDLDSSAPKTTGQGIGEYVTRNSLEWYRKLGGVAETRLMAAWVGRYVWATFGCNSPRGINFEPAECRICKEPCVKPGHHGAAVVDERVLRVEPRATSVASLRPP